jgi:hypothetical protein
MDVRTRTLPVRKSGMAERWMGDWRRTGCVGCAARASEYLFGQRGQLDPYSCGVEGKGVDGVRRTSSP